MNQIQLSETQLVILSAACARGDGLVFPITAKLKGGAVGNVLKSLLKRGLIEEVPAIDPDTVWRHDEDVGSITLRATALGCSALGIEPDDDAPTAPTGATGGEVEVDATNAATEADNAPAGATADNAATLAPATRATRADSKQARLIAMLKRPEGATVAEIAEAFGWLNHTIRGVIAGALKKKLGLAVTSEKIDDRGRVYFIRGEG
jgi:hypothetical protein